MATCVCVVVGEREIWSQGKYTTHCLVCTPPELYVCGGECITYMYMYMHAFVIVVWLSYYVQTELE